MKNPKPRVNEDRNTGKPRTASNFEWKRIEVSFFKKTLNLVRTEGQGISLLKNPKPCAKEGKNNFKSRAEENSKYKIQ